jgi:transcriptional regulator with GAF, ATPase, and Fis domain
MKIFTGVRPGLSDNRGLTKTTGGCHHGRVVKQIESAAHAELFEELKRVRAAAMEHYVAAQQLSRQRRQLIDTLLAEGFSQADVARELGVTRQAIQKMIVVGQERPRR